MNYRHYLGRGGAKVVGIGLHVPMYLRRSAMGHVLTLLLPFIKRRDVHVQRSGWVILSHVPTVARR